MSKDAIANLKSFSPVENLNEKKSSGILFCFFFVSLAMFLSSCGKFRSLNKLETGSQNSGQLSATPSSTAHLKAMNLRQSQASLGSFFSKSDEVVFEFRLGRKLADGTKEYDLYKYDFNPSNSLAVVGQLVKANLVRIAGGLDSACYVIYDFLPSNFAKLVCFHTVADQSVVGGLRRETIEYLVDTRNPDKLININDLKTAMAATSVSVISDDYLLLIVGIQGQLRHLVVRTSATTEAPVAIINDCDEVTVQGSNDSIFTQIFSCLKKDTKQIWFFKFTESFQQVAIEVDGSKVLNSDMVKALDSYADSQKYLVIKFGEPASFSIDRTEIYKIDNNGNYEKWAVFPVNQTTNLIAIHGDFAAVFKGDLAKDGVNLEKTRVEIYDLSRKNEPQFLGLAAESTPDEVPGWVRPEFGYPTKETSTLYFTNYNRIVGVNLNRSTGIESVTINKVEKGRVCCSQFILANSKYLVEIENDYLSIYDSDMKELESPVLDLSAVLNSAEYDAKKLLSLMDIIASGRHHYANALKYEPRYPLFSDGVEKERFFYVPPGEKIDNSMPDSWIFPKGSVIWKNFFDGAPNRTLYESRILVKNGSGMGDSSWQKKNIYLGTKADGSKQYIERQASETNIVNTADTFGHNVPHLGMCINCHSATKDFVLGIDSLQVPFSSGSINLKSMFAGGILKKEETQQEEIKGSAKAQAAMGYLHTNCGTCHNPAGIAAGVGLNLRHSAGTATFAEENAYQSLLSKGSIVPGQPDSSPVYLRITNQSNPMPPKAPMGLNTVLDTVAKDVIRAWISEL